jgi:hypothetical protein
MDHEVISKLFTCHLFVVQTDKAIKKYRFKKLIDSVL